MSFMYPPDDMINAMMEMTIDLQSDVDTEEEEKYADDKRPPPRIGAPRSPDEFIVTVPRDIPVTALSTEVRDIIINHLQLPSFTSMKVWKEVAIGMGLGMDEVMGMDRIGSMARSVMDKIAMRSLNELLKLLAKVKRVDTLYSIAPHLMKMKDNHESNVVHPYNTPSTSYPSTSIPMDPSLPSILLLHWENDKEESRIFRWFKKNMNKEGMERKNKVVDALEVMKEGGNVFDSLEVVCRYAARVVICISPSYRPFISDRKDAVEDSQHLQMARMLHDKTRAEVLGGGGMRCYVLLMGTVVERNDIPLDWCSTWTWFRFPSDWRKFSSEIFG